ncbi:MAG: SGNH/GDSL hydrolase family protein [Burkholderiaceae bacterium]
MVFSSWGLLAAGGALAQASPPVPLSSSAIAPAAATVRPDTTTCIDQPARAALRGTLPRLAERLRDGRGATIVTIGSSSTAGAGATSIQATYPSRLAVELLRQFPGQSIRVVNSGVNGEEVAEMLRRFKIQVFDYQPDLVVWQVGTNALLRNVDAEAFERGVRDGLERIRSARSDVILMNLQFAPRVEVSAGKQQMLERIDRLAEADGVPVFDRYAVMRGWADALGRDYHLMIAPDGLHQNDSSYRCLARELASAIGDAVRRADREAAAVDPPRAGGVGPSLSAREGRR